MNLSPKKSGREMFRLKRFCRIATRYDKKADNYLALLTLASYHPAALVLNIP
ncbi:hypothetical protein GTQ43_03900 [Nostoc sp. KVJ3]|uniref:hypothetical protein n=1 Tax=Nostoc sp. KVJ3 TaxID=457945 RepID=UPI0022387D70|nr:hypothetical protein [Nostoc sp. KVJ3]MCW5313021.1 hypothetical protein [Nostoc sp. KVJ3]